MSRIAEFTGEQNGTCHPDTQFADFGLSSRDAVVLAGELQRFAAWPLPETVAWDHPSPQLLARYLAGAEHAPVAPDRPLADVAAGTAAVPVAVVGMACRFPGAPSAGAFWSMLESGRDGFASSGDRRGGRPHGFLPGIDQFDAALFAISDLEASYVDPQQRLMLEVAWEALEDAAIAPTSLAGSRTGVFAGISGSDYGRLQVGEAAPPSKFSVTGQAVSIAANRLSYLLDLRGVSLAVDSACSSSLVSVHLAVRSLRTGESDLALAGGVSVLLAPEITEILAEAGMMAPDGRCKTFDAAADGYVRSEGCGLVVLKRLPDAIADGDRVLGVITGSAAGQDGRTNGLTAPNGLAQQAVLRDALRDARTDPGEIDYVEAHGSGTSLGDQIELGALHAVFGEARDAGQPLLLGSAKAHIGHAEAAAGIAGLIKVLLMLGHRQVPGQIHLRQANPQLPAGGPVSVPRRMLDWATAPGRPRVAGVSSFGFGGTNSHVIVREAPQAAGQPAETVCPRPCHVITVSANSDSALGTLAGRYAEWLRGHPDADLGAVSRTTTLGRAHLHHRAALVAGTHDEAVAGLLSLNDVAKAAPVYRGRRGGANGRLAMLFSGVGSQYLHMGRQLYVSNALFRDHLHRCQELLLGHLDVPLLAVLFPLPHQRQLLDRMRYLQPAMVAVGYALAQVWRSWGVVPDLVLGHSTGEFTAACVAGAIDLTDALPLVAERGRLIEELCEPGSMSVVFASEELVREVAAAMPAGHGPTIAAVNAPDAVVVAARAEDLTPFLAKLSEQGVASRPMKSSHAFHSPMMLPAREPFARAAHRLTVRSGAIEMVSDLDGRLFADGYRPDASYWVRQLTDPVRFADGIRLLAQQGCSQFIEAGPGRTLVSAGQRIVPDAVWVSSLRPGVGDWASLSDAVACLYAAGRDIDWAGFHRGYGQDRLTLPGYPFERRRHWLPQEGPGSEVEAYAPIAGQGHSAAQEDSILATLSRVISPLLGRQSPVDPGRPLLELGADSMTLFQMQQTMHKTFHVTVPIGMLFGELNTLNRLAGHILDVAPPDVLAAMPAADGNAVTIPAASGLPSPLPAGGEPAGGPSGPGVEQFLRVHAEVMRHAYELMRGSTPAPTDDGSVPENSGSGRTTAAPPGTFVAFRTDGPGEAHGLTGSRAVFAEELVRRFAARTRRSGEMAISERPRHSDMRHAMPVLSDLAQIRYPVIADRSAGSHIWDIDGNEYIDLTMGFGVNLFGHQEPFIISAIAEQLSRGMQLGPHSSLAGETARLICDMTGHERIVYCNTGSEAVMVAVRLARAVTGRRRIALFAGAYHGSADPVLARQDVERGSGESVPMAPGITEDISRNALVLPYGDDSSLEVLRAHRDELAAVLVEPVQTRHPDLQPIEFLGHLRELTRAAGIALIFDEVVTGFRTHPGGVQALFGIKADIATYGKVLGGGLPIGVIAGDARYLDAIDGASWRSDGSRHQESVRTFFTGTFAKHPLALAAARAVLTELKRRGPGLQEELNSRTAALAQQLGAAFDAAGLAARVESFGSQFRFSFPDEPPWSPTVELFYTALLEKGLYIWEGRTCFLSTAHTDADVAAVVSAVSSTAAEMVAAGFSAGARDAHDAHDAAPPPASWPLSRIQQEMWLLSRLHGDRPRVSPVSGLLEIRGELELEALRWAVTEVLSRHDTLRSVITSDGTQQQLAQPPADPPLVDLAGLTEAERSRQLASWLDTRAEEVLDLETRPPVRAALLRLAADHHQVYLSVHHAMIDGWSFDVILPEIVELLHGRLAGKSVTLPEPVQYREHVAWERQCEQSPAWEADARYWREQFADGLPELMLPTDRPRSAATNCRVGATQREISRDTMRRLPSVASRLAVTPFTVLLAAYGYLLHQLSGQDDLVIAVPFARRGYPGGEQVVGNCSATLPVRSRISREARVHDYVQALHATLVSGYEHSDFSIAELRKRIRVGDGAGGRIFAAGFNLDQMSTLWSPPGLQLSVIPLPRRFDQTDVAFDLMQAGEDLRLTVYYNEDLLDQTTADQYACAFDRVLGHFIADPDQPLDRVRAAAASNLDPVLQRWTGRTSVAAPPATLPALIERRASESPEAIAVCDEDDRLSYAELNARANRLARYLAELGAGPEHVVSLAIPVSVALVVGTLAVLKAGAACNPLEIEPSRAQRVLTDVRPAIVMTVRETAGLAGNPGPARVVLDDPATARQIRGRDGANLSDAERRHPLMPEHPAFVYYMGRGKGVVIPHASIVNTVRWWLGECPLAPGDRTLVTAPAMRPPSVHELFWPLSAGAMAIVAKHSGHQDPDYLAGLARHTGTTSAQFAPATLRDFLGALGSTSCENLRRVLCSGDTLPAELGERLRERLDVELVNLYGPAEAPVWSMAWRTGQPGAAPPVGQPAWDTTVRVLDRNLDPVSPGFAGELYVAGPGLARGYLRRPDLTAERFLPVPAGLPGERMYRTGRLARWSADGRLHVAGSAATAAEVPEVRTEQGAIEAALRMLPV